MIACNNRSFSCGILLAAAILTSSCSDEGTESRSGTEQAFVRTSTTGCVPPAHAPSRQCVFYCPPDELHISVDQFSEYSQLACTGACAGNNDFQGFVFHNEDVDLSFSFEPSIVGNYSSENFKSKFNYLNATVTLPNGANSGYRATLGPIRTGDTRLVGLDYNAGRLIGHVDFGSITRVSRAIESREKTCMNGDIMGQCFCTYEIPPTPVDIKFSLAVPQSGAVSNEQYLALAEEAVLSSYPVQYLRDAKFACNKAGWYSEVGYSCQIRLDQRYGLRIIVVQRENRWDLWDVVDVSRYDRDD